MLESQNQSLIEQGPLQDEEYTLQINDNLKLK